MKKRTLIISALVLIVVLALIIIGKNRNKGEIEVQTGKVEQRTIISTVSANGKLRPENEIKISADVSGEIIELHVAEGDTVTEGQLLLKINPDLYLTALDRAKANVSTAMSAYKTNESMLIQAQSRFAEQELIFERNRKLLEDKVISQSEFDAIKTIYQVAESEVKAAKERISAAKFGIDNAQAGLVEARKNLERTNIFSPTTGVISALNSEKGERVVGTAQMAGTEIMVISNFNNIEVIVEVNENDILQIDKGDTAIVEVDAYISRTFKGIVTEIARSSINAVTGQQSGYQVTNYEVKIRLLKSSYSDLAETTDAPFLPGMSANVEIQTDVATGINCLPIEAVSTRPGEKKDSLSSSGSEKEKLDEVVFSIKEGKVRKHIVGTGLQDSRYIEIKSGLDSVKEVIIGPYDAISKKLEEGKIVKVGDTKKDIKLEE